jgi:hypothetical protein
VAEAAAGLAEQIDPRHLTDPTPLTGTVDDIRGRVTLADALERAGAPELRRTLVRPALDVAILTSSQRCPADERMPAAAVELARRVRPMLGHDPAAAMRLMLEAHVLFAATSRRSLMRHGFGVPGSHWATALLACSRHRWDAGDAPLALDLAAWMGGVVEQLTPLATVDQRLRALAVECVSWHAWLLGATGEEEGARTAAAHADELARLASP